MSTKNMAKRTAAGTLALAVCIGGGSLALAGAANAALPTAGDYTGSVATSANGTPAAQVLRTSGQSLTDFSVSLPASSSGVSRWFSGDRIVIQLPANVAFSAAPTVTAVKVSGDGTTAPTFTVASLATTDDPSTSVAGPTADPVAAVRQYAITFTNSQGTTAADNLSVWKLAVSGVKVDLTNFQSGGVIGLGGSANTVSATTDANGKVYGQTYDANSGTYTNTYAYTDQTGAANTADVIGYALDAQVSIASNYTFVNNGGIQAAPDVTITEPFAGSWSGTTAAIQFRDANGVIAQLDNTTGAIGNALAPTLSFNGTAVTSGTFVFNSGGDSLTTPSITPTSGVDKVVIGNIRFKNATTLVGPIKAFVTSPAATQVSGVNGFQAVSGGVTINDPNTRLGGATRYDTAAQIVAAAQTATNYSDFVLASGEGSGVDALSANYVGGATFGVGGITDRPVLLTSKSWLPDGTLSFLKTKVPAATPSSPRTLTFTVMGGTSAIDDSVLGQIKDAFPTSQGYNVKINRYAGDDRYETAAAAAINVGAGSIASFSNTYGKPAVRTAILASGENSADAVVAGGLAYGGNFPLLLTAKGGLPDATVNALNTLEIKQVVIVGGTSAVSQSVEDKLKGMGITIIRKAGDDRYGTALQVAEFARTPVASTNVKTDAGLGWNTAVYNASGNTWASTTALLGNGGSYADLLAAGQLSGNAGGSTAGYQPLLTTEPSKLTDSTKKWLTDHSVSISGVTGLGGATAVSWDALTAAVNAQK